MKLALALTIIYGFFNIEGKYNVRERDYCLALDDNPFTHFSTKAPYEFIRENAGIATDCKPIQIWMMIRHGTRFANIQDVKKMRLAPIIRDQIIDNYENSTSTINNGLCQKDYAAIKNWKWDKQTELTPNYLNEQGWKDIDGIARRYKMRYPGILGGNYSEKDFYFRHTCTERTTESCNAFIDALFGKGAHHEVKIETPLKYDLVIQTFEMCKAWKVNIQYSDYRAIELRVFRKSDVYKKLQENVSKRLGFSNVLNHDFIDIMYENCRFDKTRYLDKVSPWCAVFSKDELQIMEYYHDLEKYYFAGYGHEYHHKLGCFSLQDLRETFEKTVAEGKAEPKVIAMFTHDAVLNMMFTAMNYSRDQKPLKGSNFEDHFVDRKYRLTYNIPFAANVVALLHECSNRDEKYQVEFLINERPMEVQGCDKGLCSWTYLEKFLAFTKNCSLDFCDKI